jgi:hypothetical protein
MYDYFLGGYHNFEIDRRAAAQVLEVLPDTPLIMRANRAFLRRAVSFLSNQGIDQFLDIGSGIPTVGSVHEIVQRINPATRVVYVDIDPIAVIHSEAILKDVPNTAVIQADARQPAQLLAHTEVQRLIDFSRPVAVLLVALLHFITDDDEAMHLVRAFREILPSGGYLAISHGTSENVSNAAIQAGAKVYARSTNPVVARSRAQIAAFFEGFELVEPGLVYVPLWSPEGPEDLFIDEPERSVNIVGVGRKP